LEEYRDASRLCRDGVRRAKGWLELTLARDAKNDKSFYRYVNHKSKVKERVPPPVNKNGNLVSADEKASEVLNNFSASVFTGNLSPHPSLVNGSQGDQGVKSLPQNHRTLGAGRDLCGSSSPTPLPKQGHLQ